MNSRLVQKRPQLKVSEYSGAGWFAQVYETAPHCWAWACAVDLGERLLTANTEGYTTASTALAGLRLFARKIKNRGDILKVLSRPPYA